MKHKYILTWTLIIYSSITFGQAFSNDWKEFTLPTGWNLNIKKNNQFIPFAKKETIGTIEFNYNNDSLSHSVEFIVFNYFKTDTALTKNLLDYMIIQSCLDFININKPFFKSFDKNGFYYFLKPCHGCHLNQYLECQELANKLNESIKYKFVISP